MEFVQQVVLNPIQLGVVGILCILSIWYGRMEIPIGAYLSLTLWTRTVMFGPIAHTWVFMAVTLAASAVYLFRTKRPLGTLLPYPHRWIVIWMGLWWMWMLLGLTLFDASNKSNFIQPLLTYVIFPLPIVLLFAKDEARIRLFAVTYLITTMLNGIVSMWLLEITLSYLASDPTLNYTNIQQLGLRNYHWFAHGFAIALILAIGLYLNSKSTLARILLISSACYCIYFLFLAGSRQSLNGGIVAGAIAILWALKYHKGAARTPAALIAATTVFIGVTIFALAPHLVLRQDEGDYTNTFDLLGDRGALWAKGFGFFLASPLWGNGFEYSVYAHNIFISTLSDQGIIGFILLIGFLVFFVRRCRGIWKGHGPTWVATWRVCFMCIGIFGLIHSQASNDAISVWHLYWSAAFMWVLGDGLEDPQPEPSALKQRVLANRPERTPAPELRTGSIL